MKKKSVMIRLPHDLKGESHGEIPQKLIDQIAANTDAFLEALRKKEELKKNKKKK